MADFVSRVRATVGRPPELLESIDVLRRAGLFRASHPAEAARAALSVRRYGPFAGPMRAAAWRDPDALGLLDELGGLTYEQLDRRSNALARAWRRRGLSSGDVVGLLSRNHRWFLDTIFACAKIGAAVVLVNTGFGTPQLAEVAARERISVLVYDQEFAPLVAGAPPTISRYLGWLDVPAAADVPTIEELIAQTDEEDLAPPRSPGTIVLLTSGTTGIPRAAPRQVRSPLAAAEFLDRVPYRRNETTMIATPLFHGTGTSQLVVTLALGSTVVLARRFDPASTLARIAHYRCTGLVVIPTMLQRILVLGEQVLARYDTRPLRIILSAGSALSPELGNRTIRAFGNVLHNLYGSTEVSVATVATPRDWRRAPGTVGRPPVGCRVRLYDEHDRQVRTAYQRGRIFVGGGLTVSGYTGGGSKEEIGGLLATGDIGHFDNNGLLFVDGRSDDMIVTGGENVYPEEIEHLLAGHPYVEDAAVVGVGDAEYGQRLRAYVVLVTGVWVAPDELREFVRTHLARFKVPREITYVESLPRNPTGKILRHLLR